MGQNLNTEITASILRTTFNIVLLLTYSITVLSQPDWKEYVYLVENKLFELSVLSQEGMLKFYTNKITPLKEFPDR